MYGVVGESGPAPGDDPDADEGDCGAWNVGLCEGAWSGFFGRSDTGGELITSDWAVQLLFFRVARLAYP